MTMVRDFLRRQVESRWYGRPGWLFLLMPLSILYRIIAERRRTAALELASHDASSANESLQGVVPPPVVVVGNIVAGGTGKTPVVAHVVERLRDLGALPGVVARGYGAAAGIAFPRVVTPQSDPRLCGDEAIELAQRLACPVVVGPDRAAAARWLHQYFHCDVIVSDDGLQHYRLKRSFECAIVDAERQHGNGHLLPVGPLREPVARLESVNCVIETTRAAPDAAERPGGGEVESRSTLERVPRLRGQLRPVSATHMLSDQTVALADAPFIGNDCVALSGIGNPNRFHEDLYALGCTLTQRALADHHSYAGFVADWPGDSLVVTTGKDAVKLVSLTDAKEPGWLDQVWVLNRRLIFSPSDELKLDRLLARMLQLSMPKPGQASGATALAENNTYEEHADD